MSFKIVYSETPVSHCIHSHVYYELLYVAEGSVLIRIRNQEYRADAGSLVFINQFDEHATQTISDIYKRYYLLIPPTQLDAFHHDVLLLSVFRFHGEGFPYVLSVGESKPRFDLYFSLLRDAAARGGDYLDARIESLMTLILADAYAVRPNMFIPGDDASFLPMQNLLTELDRTYAEPFSLQALAARYHVSAGCLSSHFRRQVGMSPMQYVTLSRLNHARTLLRSTDLSVMEIAMQCGYAD
ncbi:MAG: AraC family transcriptional regulator, partial [Christensenellales bacterium]|nr:AraC family transcriptional regulator [Christensenellales bacterium]